MDLVRSPVDFARLCLIILASSSPAIKIEIWTVRHRPCQFNRDFTAFVDLEIREKLSEVEVAHFRVNNS